MGIGTEMKFIQWYLSIEWHIIWQQEEMKYWYVLQQDGYWKHYAKWKKTNPKDHIVYKCVYMKYPE